MAESSIPVDLLNPGQVFACLGFLDAADILLGDAEGGFDWSDGAEVHFVMRASGEEQPVSAVLRFLASAEAHAIAPSGSNHAGSWKRAWPELRWLDEEAPFPFPDPPSPATLPAVLEGPSHKDGPRVRISIEYWGDPATRREVKFWGGSAGYPGAARARDMLSLIRQRLRPDSGALDSAVQDPLNVSAEQSSSFRLDWRRDYVPIDIGFSLNTHEGKISAVGFPIVELLAAIGLSRARPTRLNRLDYRYGVLSAEHGLLDPILLRAGLGGTQLPLPQRNFRMKLTEPGKEGQERAISTVTEEAIP